VNLHQFPQGLHNQQHCSTFISLFSILCNHMFAPTPSSRSFGIPFPASQVPSKHSTVNFGICQPTALAISTPFFAFPITLQQPVSPFIICHHSHSFPTLFSNITRSSFQLLHSFSPITIMPHICGTGLHTHCPPHTFHCPFWSLVPVHTNPHPNTPFIPFKPPTFAIQPSFLAHTGFLQHSIFWPPTQVFPLSRPKIPPLFFQGFHHTFLGWQGVFGFPLGFIHSQFLSPIPKHSFSIQPFSPFLGFGGPQQGSTNFPPCFTFTSFHTNTIGVGFFNPKAFPPISRGKPL